MEQNCIDWFIVYSQDPHLSEYTAECDRLREKISGFSGSAGTLLVGATESYLWTDSRYYIQAADQLEGSGITLMKSQMPGVPGLPRFLRDHVWDGQVLAVDRKTVSYDEYGRLLQVLPSSIEVTDGGKILRGLHDSKRVFNGIKAVPQEHRGKEITAKLDDVRKRIAGRIGGESSYTYVVSDLTSIMWLYNLRGDDITHVPVAYSYTCITAFSAVLYISRKHLTEEAAKMLDEAGVTVKEYSRFYTELSDVATDVILADTYRNNAAIIEGAEETATLQDVSDAELIAKPFKNASEIKGMEDAHIKDAVTMIRFIKNVKETAAEGKLPDEYEMGRMLDRKRLEGGCRDLSFDTICAYGPNAAIVHYTAKQDECAAICNFGFLLVDSGGQYEFEGTTDITRTISLGKLTEEEIHAYTTVLRGNLRLMDMIFPEGCKGTLLDTAAENVLWENGYYCGHGIGHGVGCYLSVHESEIRISRNVGERECAFFPGVIVSDEPGIYIEGKFGIRLENLLLTVGAGELEGHKMCRFTPLTLVPFDKEAIDMKLLSEREKDVLIRYCDLISEKVLPLLSEDEQKWLSDYMNFS